METQNINIAIPKDLHTFFKVYAAQNGTTMKDLMVKYIESLKKEEEEKERKKMQYK